jgi:cytochrome c biogenesis protein CcmG, thiol:disulfide interchange protein DsbE
MTIKALNPGDDPVWMVTERPVRRFARMRIALTALAVVLLAAGCGNSDPDSAAPSQAQIKRALKGAPPKLTALHNQGSQLLGGGKPAFQERMEELRGYPVVINSWGSWCAPCRAEFPVFQRVALAFGKRVAFLGLDAQDNDGNARKFLERFPVTYPSYRDPDVKISNSVRAGGFFPTTIFFDRKGKLVYAHPGPYDKDADLIADIKRYAL